jgi:hypothetical protein
MTGARGVIEPTCGKRSFEAATMGGHNVQCHPSNVPCPLPRRTEQRHASTACLFVRPFPTLRWVGVRIGSFEACSAPGSQSGGYSRYGPPDRSTAQGRLCQVASAWPATQPNRWSATGLIDIFPGGTSLR